jgi:hypothetical protein
MQIMARPDSNNPSHPTVPAPAQQALSLNPSIKNGWVHASQK